MRLEGNGRDRGTSVNRVAKFYSESRERSTAGQVRRYKTMAAKALRRYVFKSAFLRCTLILP